MGFYQILDKNKQNFDFPFFDIWFSNLVLSTDVI